ncbi:MAG: hypothetical protein LUQ69_09885, partial [Methanoregulaceae archaeon]|nr:hypothetical protein [Methanoregulaceae archaeon]
TMSGLDPAQLDPAKLIKNLSMKEWVAKDTYLPQKSEVELVMEISGQDISPSAASAGTITLNLKAGISFYDYNLPVSITVPPEALVAKEVPAKS